jgi:hypothetical protein
LLSLLSRERAFRSSLSLREAGNWKRSRINKLQSSDFLELVTRFLVFSSTYRLRYHPLPVIPTFPVITGNAWLHGYGRERSALSTWSVQPSALLLQARRNHLEKAKRVLERLNGVGLLISHARMCNANAPPIIEVAEFGERF